MTLQAQLPSISTAHDNKPPAAKPARATTPIFDEDKKFVSKLLHHVPQYTKELADPLGLDACCAPTQHRPTIFSSCPNQILPVLASKYFKEIVDPFGLDACCALPQSRPTLPNSNIIQVRPFFRLGSLKN